MALVDTDELGPAIRTFMALSSSKGTASERPSGAGEWALAQGGGARSPATPVRTTGGGGGGGG
eukprot:CAMPEP_0203832500 /NCGR_PEP_ID=MMETSP0115-20131106/70939_1 /ASSEMBLY_ACC=CAM_ASM_000227 /TAXON_ID=33651 /ORGANISM="Bicosoecid sp, Strain ms1" /LENGTH=62 /DNA_ID=CAMNT_0050741569 /DNA_START=105 /DNA_END=289 /DNA_ORIENTATION=+